MYKPILGIVSCVISVVILVPAIVLLVVFLTKTSNSANIYYNGEFRILNISYKKTLATRDTADFFTLSQEIVKLMDTVYLNSNLASDFIGTKVAAFRPGSIRVSTVLKFKGDSFLLTGLVDHAFHQSLLQINNKTQTALFDRFNIDLNSIQFTELTEAEVEELFLQDVSTTTTTSPENIPTSSPSCGNRPKVISRIVGGTNALPGQWPWQVSLQVRSHVCGASIISDRWLLSAAHCFQGQAAPPSLWKAYMGSTTLGGGTSRTIRRIITHPNYNDIFKLDNDIAVLELSSPLIFTDFIQPVCLPSTSHIFSNGQTCTVTGWGLLSHEGNRSTRLQKANVKIIKNSMCNKSYTLFITSRMLCASVQGEQIGSCQGDSGGPLVCQQFDGTWLQAGIVSFGPDTGCGLPHVPDGYSRVTSHRDWVQQMTGV